MIQKQKIMRVLIEGCEYVFMLMLVLTTNSVYNHMPKHPTLFSAILYISGMMLFLLNYSNIKKILYKIENVKFIKIYLVLWILVGLFTTQDTYSRNLVVFGQFGLFLPIVVFLTLTYIQENHFYHFLEKFVNIVTFLAVSSTILFALSTLKMIHPTSNPIVDWGGIFSRDMYYGLLIQSEEHIGKNLGIFPEPPMYNLVLIMALLIEQCLSSSLSRTNKLTRKQWIRSCFLIIAILSSKSITGYILAICIFLGKGIKWFIKNKRQMSVTMRRIIVFSLFMLVLFGGTVFLQKSNSLSWATRIDDFYATFYAWMEHPLFGNGYGNIQSVYPYMSLFRLFNMGLANSIGWILVQGGIPYFLIYFYPLFSAIKKNRGNDFNFLLFSCVFLVDLIFTIFSDIPICFFTLGMIIANILGDNTWKRVDNDHDETKLDFQWHTDNSFSYTIILFGLMMYYTCSGINSSICSIVSKISILFTPCFIVNMGMHVEIFEYHFKQYKYILLNLIANIYLVSLISYFLIFIKTVISGGYIFDLSFIYLSEIAMGNTIGTGLLNHIWCFWLILIATVIINKIHISEKNIMIFSIMNALLFLLLSTYLLQEYSNLFNILIGILSTIIYLLIGKNSEKINKLMISKLPFSIHIILFALMSVSMIYVQYTHLILVFGILIYVWVILLMSFIDRLSLKKCNYANELDLYYGLFYSPVIIYFLYTFVFERISHGYVFVLMILMIIFYTAKKKEGIYG